MAKADPSLLEHAVAAVQNIHAVQVGLAKAGADDGALKAVGQCAAIMAQVTKALGSGPSLDQASGGSPSPASAGQPAGAPSPSAGPAQASAAPPQAAPQPPPGQQTAHHAMKAASSALQSAMAASANK